MKKLAVLLPKYRELTMRAKYFQQILIMKILCYSFIMRTPIVRYQICHLYAM